MRLGTLCEMHKLTFLGGFRVRMLDFYNLYNLS